MAASRDPEYVLHSTSVNPNSIIFDLGDDAQEMLRIAPDGFYIRGKKIPQDDREAELVYNAIKEFLVYHNLSRSY